MGRVFLPGAAGTKAQTEMHRLAGPKTADRCLGRSLVLEASGVEVEVRVSSKQKCRQQSVLASRPGSWGHWGEECALKGAWSKRRAQSPDSAVAGLPLGRALTA